MKKKVNKLSVFPKRLKMIRTSADYTQQQAADELEISLRNYQKYESGETEPSLNNLAILAKLYGTTSDYLLGLTDKI